MRKNKNNKVLVYGEIVSEIQFINETHGERFFEFNVKVQRLSGVFDILPIRISSRLIFERELIGRKLNKGDMISLVGQFRSFNKNENGKSKLVLTIFANAILDDLSKKTNEIYLKGYLCKPTNYRITPLNREVADLLIAVNRKHKRSDYIPCIAWGRNARFVENLNVGDKIEIYGRIQSREYQKKISETETKTMTAYEVSISSLSIEE